MQRVIRLAHKGFRRAGKSRIRDRHALLGTVVALVGVVALATTTLLYVHPPHQKTIRFRTTDASSINVGESVRVAGIDVGKVSRLSIEPTTVLVEARISDSTFIGSDTTIDVRLLTPVGGYAVTVVPAGNAALGNEVISPDHVSVPYSIGDVIQAAPHATDKIEGDSVHATIDQVAQALQHNSTSVGSIIAGMNSIATVMDQQRDQVRTITDLASEYLQSFNGSRAWIYQLLSKVDIVLTTYNNTHVGFNEAYRLLGDILYRLEPFEKFYLEHKDEIRGAVDRLRSAVDEFRTTLGPTLDKLQTLRDQLQSWLGPDGLKTLGGGTILASQICVPISGRTC